MISSHKAVRPRGLCGSSARSRFPDSPSPNFHPSSSIICQRSNHRGFSWGAKHKVGDKDAGKVYKGFSTHDHSRALKQIYRGTFWNHHYTPHLRRYLPLQDWRLSSSWEKIDNPWNKSNEYSSSRSHNEKSAHEDSYRRYQLQKKKHYDDFMKKMEEDPVGMLFGRTWTNWIEGSETRTPQTPGTKTQESEGTFSGERPQANCRKPAEGSNASIQRADTSKILESMIQEFEIDPITNRKVPKVNAKPKGSSKAEKPVTKNVSPEVRPSVSDQTQDTQLGSQIPVKRYHFKPEISRSKTTESCDPPSVIEEMSSSIHTPPQPPDWLAQEGFTSGQQPKTCKPSIGKTAAGSEKIPSKKLESALDRHLQAKDSEVQGLDRRIPQYKPKENTTEDLDLLRSSDVRASAGLRGRAPKESEIDKQTRQTMLELEYNNGSQRREKELAQEIAELPQRKSGNTKDASKGNEHQNSQTHCANHNARPSSIQDFVETERPSVQAVPSGKLEKIKAQIVPLKARLDAMKADYDSLRQRWLDEKRRKEAMAAKKIEDIHKEEVKAQKVAMEAMEIRHTKRTSQEPKSLNKAVVDGTSNTPAQDPQGYLPGEGDVAGNVHEFASRERWYKKRAPHAKDEIDTTLRKFASDQDLIREVKEIYEETYGTIEKDHRQAALSGDGNTSFDTSHQPTSQIDSHTGSKIADHAFLGAENDLSHQQLNDIASSDPLATIQRLFDALRRAQSLVQEDRNHLQQLANPSKSQLSSISESSNALEIVQKLFNELRKAQLVFQDERATREQVSNPAEIHATMQASEAYNQSLKEIVQTTWKLVSMNQSLPQGGTTRDPSNTRTTSDTAEQSDPFVVSESSPTNSTLEDFKPAYKYRILAYDWTGQQVISEKATCIAPFSKEEPLLVAEALKLLNNPGKFLPDLMALHKKGYTVVSGNEKTLILKRLATPEEVEQSEREEEEESSKDLYHVDRADPHQGKSFASGIEGISQPHLTSQGVSAYRDALREEVTGHADVASRSQLASQSKLEPESARPSSAASATSPLDSLTTESNLPPSENVRREEAVFSGPPHGNWQEAENRRLNKKTKRLAKRSQKLKNMLWTGTLTAGCCYAVGVISQMLQH